MLSFCSIFFACFLVMCSGQGDQSNFSTPSTVVTPTNDPTEICRKKFNDSQDLEGEQILKQCSIACRNRTSLNPRVPMGMTKMDDGAICGDNRECLDGACHHKEDIAICRRSMGQNVTSMIYFQCWLVCGNGTEQITQIGSDANGCVRMSILPIAFEGGRCNNGTCVER